ncbi:MAG TPA: hypothetical protein VK907_01740 [Phnomibacter sp.]|nr:hypothetical protein [Phnomibacter sp.]
MANSTNEGVTRLEPMPDALLAELFPRGIVAIADEVQAPAGSEEKAHTLEEKTPVPASMEAEMSGSVTLPVLDELSWLGNFAKQVLVVVNDPTALHLNDANFELLGKIISAVKLSMDDIALVNAATHSLEYNALNEKLPARIALYFGIEPVDIGAPLKFPKFQVQQWNHSTFVCAPALQEMIRDTEEARSHKKELWAAMKKVFG